MTCKDCRYGIPDTDMGGYECELDHGLRYGYDGCDAEELKAKVTEALPALCDYFEEIDSKAERREE